MIYSVFRYLWVSDGLKRGKKKLQFPSLVDDIELYLYERICLNGYLFYVNASSFIAVAVSLFGQAVLSDTSEGHIEKIETQIYIGPLVVFIQTNKLSLCDFRWARRYEKQNKTKKKKKKK